MNQIKSVPKVYIGHPCEQCEYLELRVNNDDDKQSISIKCLVNFLHSDHTINLGYPEGCPLVQDKKSKLSKKTLLF